MKLLLERAVPLGLDAGAATDDGTTAIHIAASRGHLALVELLLGWQPRLVGLSIHARTVNRLVPLHCACVGDHAPVIRALLAAEGASETINAASDEGATPLHLACNNGCPAAVEELLQHGRALGLQVNATCSIVGGAWDGGSTPLQLAAAEGCAKCVGALLRHRLELGLDLNRRNAAGRTPLHYAVNYGHHAVAQLLASAPGIDTTIAALDGRTAWQVARDNNDTAMCELLKPRRQVARPQRPGSAIARKAWR